MKEQNTIPVYLFLFSWCPLLLGHCVCRRERRRKGKLQVTVINGWLLSAFTSKKRASKLQSLEGARETRLRYKNNHNNRKNKKCSLTMCRSHNRPSSVVCICMHIQNCSTKQIMTSVVQELWSINTLSVGPFRQKHESSRTMWRNPRKWAHTLHRAVKSAIVDSIPSNEVDELGEDSANGDDKCPRVYASSSAVARTEHE